ncbi:hypothetical protein [Pontibacter roseus]|uniref:hypothetical protein n=1 Tax=Pontibacter roseus TaxID=336989 RepID=UPI00038214C8|nr:hypothetical protein [Pontibacter roseus]
MTNHTLTWKPVDAKFLEALLLATGGEGTASLQDVLLMGDALDGEVFELKELEEALEKLLSIGFIGLEKNKLGLSPDFLQDYEQMTLQEGEDTESKPLEMLLQQQPLQADKVAAVRESVLKKYKLRNYYQAYLEQYG